MQIEENYHFQLENPKTIILQVYPAFNRTFIMLTVEKPGYGEIIIHVDVKGKQLFRHVAKDTVNFMTLLNDRTVAYSAIQDSKVVLINLEKQTVGGINHEFMSDCTAAVNIEFFLQTKLLVLMERGASEEHKLRLTYFQDNGDEEPVSQYTTAEDQFKHQYQVAKGNAHSMVIWTKMCHTDNILLWVYDLRDSLPIGVQRRPRQVLVASTVPFVTQNVLLSLANVWESKPDCFLLTCNSNLEKKDPHQANNTNFVYDAKAGILRQTKFSFKGNDNELHIDRQMFGDFSIYPTMYFKNGLAIESPVYIVNHVTEELVGMTKWAPFSIYRWFPVSYDYNSILLTNYLQSDVKEVDIKHIKMLSPSDAFMQLMLHMCDDLDDDLMQETIELLVERK